MTGLDDLVRLDATVRGQVQGVGFRYFVLRVAGGLPVSGWVSNERDGSVRCIAEGHRPDLEQLLAALHEGPPGADVQRVDEQWSQGTGRMQGFRVRPAGHTGD